MQRRGTVPSMAEPRPLDSGCLRDGSADTPGATPARRAPFGFALLRGGAAAASGGGPASLGSPGLRSSVALPPRTSLATKLVVFVFLTTFITAVLVSWTSIQATHTHLSRVVEQTYPATL